MNYKKEIMEEGARLHWDFSKHLVEKIFFAYLLIFTLNQCEREIGKKYDL